MKNSGKLKNKKEMIMKIQAIQNSTNFKNKQVLRAYRDSFLYKSSKDANAKSNCIGLINGTLLGLSACGFVGAFTDGLKMLIPAIISGVSVVIFNIARLSKNEHIK